MSCNFAITVSFSELLETKTKQKEEKSLDLNWLNQWPETQIQ